LTRSSCISEEYPAQIVGSLRGSLDNGFERVLPFDQRCLSVSVAKSPSRTLASQRFAAGHDHRALIQEQHNPLEVAVYRRMGYALWQRRQSSGFCQPGGGEIGILRRSMPLASMS